MSRKAESLPVGAVFGRLKVLGPAFPKGRYLYVPVACDCGNKKAVEQTNLRKGKVNSCGCLNVELVRARSLTHGKSGTPIYFVWNMLLQRCLNPNCEGYSDYGGRGITVCDEWLVFENFYRDMGDPPFKGASIDRRENDKGYSKDNCHWATRKVQAANKRNTIRYEYLGQPRTLQEIADLRGISYGTLYQRLFTYHWSFEKAIQ